jgi:hypothetical protein
MAREVDDRGLNLEGGECVNRQTRGGKNYRDYNGYHELKRKIRQSEMRKRHSFAGTSVFEHLKPRHNSIVDMATDWLEADLQTTRERMEHNNAMEAEVLSTPTAPHC